MPSWEIFKAGLTRSVRAASTSPEWLDFYWEMWLDGIKMDVPFLVAVFMASVSPMLVE
jgi:hypothetical protein